MPAKWTSQIKIFERPVGSMVSLTPPTIIIPCSQELHDIELLLDKTFAPYDDLDDMSEPLSEMWHALDEIKMKMIESGDHCSVTDVDRFAAKQWVDHFTLIFDDPMCFRSPGLNTMVDRCPVPSYSLRYEAWLNPSLFTVASTLPASTCLNSPLP
jgi:hypothetical protein